MTDILDQSEVDALLAAVEAGPGDAEANDTGERKIFTIDDRVLPDDFEIREYDFKRPERVSKDQMRALETLHESFSRSFGALLSGFLRTIMEVKVASIEQMTFSEFTHSLPNPTCFALIDCEPLDGTMCMEVSPLIIYPVIDRLLGGSNADLFIPQRPLTAIEMRLVGKILDRAVAGLKEAWANVKEINFSVTDTESNPVLVQIVPPNEVVVVVSFELKMGNRAGTMSLCIPYNVIEPLIEKLSNQTWAAYKRQSRDTKVRNTLANHLDAARVGISTILADTTIKLNDLKNLDVGDLILTEKPASSPLSLEIEGKRKFIGQLGQYKGNRVFRVDRPITPKDRV
ncbi:MAG: flagellar motor switch protein FliM [Phycisphaeraceae bacterium]|nr:flagellar motor switch protein FliM [Phycisphaeraceae bacterium]